MSVCITSCPDGWIVWADGAEVRRFPWGEAPAAWKLASEL